MVKEQFDILTILYYTLVMVRIASCKNHKKRKMSIIRMCEMKLWRNSLFIFINYCYFLVHNGQIKSLCAITVE